MCFFLHSDKTHYGELIQELNKVVYKGLHDGTEHAETIHIIITFVKKADNEMPTQDRSLSTIKIRGINTASNISMYHPRVFHMIYKPNQLYSTEYDWKSLQPFSTRKVKGRTLESEQYKGIRNRTQFSNVLILILILLSHRTGANYVQSRRENNSVET